jgi:hypothetical protein
LLSLLEKIKNLVKLREKNYHTSRTAYSGVDLFAMQAFFNIFVRIFHRFLMDAVFMLKKYAAP